MNCNFKLLYKTLKAQIENNLILSMNEELSFELRKHLLDEATVLESVVTMIDEERFLKDLAKAYKVL